MKLFSQPQSVIEQEISRLRLVSALAVRNYGSRSSDTPYTAWDSLEVTPNTTELHLTIGPDDLTSKRGYIVWYTLVFGTPQSAQDFTRWLKSYA